MTAENDAECTDAATSDETARVERRAFARGRLAAIGDVLAELDGMHSSMSAYDAAVDIRHTFEHEQDVVNHLEVANVDVATGAVTVFSEGARAQVAEIVKPLYGIPKSDEKLVGVRVVEGGFVEPAPSRQVRRAEERASTKQSTALTKMAENAERVVLGEEQAQKMQRMRVMLFALVKQLGRARLTQAELNAIAPKDGLDVKVQQDGSLVITYLRGRDR